MGGLITLHHGVQPLVMLELDYSGSLLLQPKKIIFQVLMAFGFLQI